jgi:hypothetical protein
MWLRLSLFLVVASQLHERAGAAAWICAEPNVPCEVSFTSTCVELLTEGEVTTDDSLRDDVSTGGCVLCVPPDRTWAGPNPCPTCECSGGDVVCFALGGAYVHADEVTAPCPPSDYEGFNDFSVSTPRCPSANQIERELDCVAKGHDTVHTIPSNPSNATVLETTLSPSSSPTGDNNVEAALGSVESIDSSSEPTSGVTRSNQYSTVVACLLCFLVFGVLF